MNDNPWLSRDVLRVVCRGGDDPGGSAIVLPEAPVGRVVHDDLGIRIDRDGTWYYHGSPIGRKELVCLFASVLSRDEAGGYWLITPTEMGRIEVEDAPFVAVELFTSNPGPDQVLSLRSNIDEIVALDGDHPLRVETDPGTGEPSPYATMGRGFEARICRSVFYELVALGVEERVDGEGLFGVWSTGVFFKIGKLDGET